MIKKIVTRMSLVLSSFLFFQIGYSQDIVNLLFDVNYNTYRKVKNDKMPIEGFAVSNSIGFSYTLEGMNKLDETNAVGMAFAYNLENVPIQYNSYKGNYQIQTYSFGFLHRKKIENKLVKNLYWQNGINFYTVLNENLVQETVPSMELNMTLGYLPVLWKGIELKSKLILDLIKNKNLAIQFYSGFSLNTSATFITYEKIGSLYDEYDYKKRLISYNFGLNFNLNRINRRESLDWETFIGYSIGSSIFFTPKILNFANISNQSFFSSSLLDVRSALFFQKVYKNKLHLIFQLGKSEISIPYSMVLNGVKNRLMHSYDFVSNSFAFKLGFNAFEVKSYSFIPSIGLSVNYRFIEPKNLYDDIELGFDFEYDSPQPEYVESIQLAYNYTKHKFIYQLTPGLNVRYSFTDYLKIDFTGQYNIGFTDIVHVDVSGNYVSGEKYNFNFNSKGDHIQLKVGLAYSLNRIYDKIVARNNI